MSELKIIHKLSGPPYELFQIGSNKHSIIDEFGKKDGENIAIYRSEHLIENVDITEFNMRNISLAIEGHVDQDWNYALYLELKGFAETFDFDYFSSHNYGTKMGKLLARNRNTQSYSISPRMFRKVPLDDRM